MVGKIKTKRRLGPDGEWINEDVYFLDGKEVTKEEFGSAIIPSADSSGPASLVSFKTMESNALAVHPTQIAEFSEYTRKHGIAVDYAPGGQPIIKSSRQFRELAKLFGLRHRGY